MTMLDDSVDPQHGSEVETSHALAASLGTVGYAMFAWLQQGALNQIRPMGDVVDAFRQVVAAEEAQRAAEEAQREASRAAVQSTGVVSGFVDYLPQQAPATPEPAAVEQTAAESAPQEVAAAAAAVVPEVAPEPAAEEAPEPARQDPYGGIPPVNGPVEDLGTQQYTGRQTLEMLQEISFLDE